MVDDVAADCHDLGSCGVQVESAAVGVVLLAYFDDDAPADLRDRIVDLLTHRGLGRSGVSVSAIPQQDWEADWRRFFSPIWVTPRIVIHPSWIPVEVEDGQIAIIIDPRMAFGTGEHESTQLCLQMIEEIVEPGGRCLDFGTGSGILAIAAARLGAGPVRALDTDPAAVLNARENLIRNGIPSTQVQVSKGSVDRVSGERFDLILGNIQSSVLRPLLSAIRGCLGGGGQVVLSGLLAREQEAFCADVEREQLRVAEVRSLGEWIGVRAQAV